MPLHREQRVWVLTKCRVLLKAKAFTFKYYANDEPAKCILDEELKVSSVIGQS